MPRRGVAAAQGEACSSQGPQVFDLTADDDETEAHSLEESQGDLEPCPELLHNEIPQRKLEEMLAKQEAKIWKEVQQAIREDDMETLLHLLARHEMRLSAEKIEEANRKMPGIEARIKIRKGLEVAFKYPSDLVDIRVAVDAAKRSVLPREEVAIAEERLRQLCEGNDIARRENERRASEKETEKTCREVEVKTTLQENLSSPWGIQLQEAIRSGDRESTRLAVENARNHGMSTREISWLQAHVRRELSGTA